MKGGLKDVNDAALIFCDYMYQPNAEQLYHHFSVQEGKRIKRPPNPMGMIL